MSEYLDTSCIVKWFKEDEEYHEESLKLRERILNFETEFVMSYYGLLELIRALVKSKYPKQKIEEAFQNMYDLYGIGALKNVRIEEVLYLATNIEYREKSSNISSNADIILPPLLQSFDNQPCRNSEQVSNLFHPNLLEILKKK